MSLATGRYPHNHGVWQNRNDYTLPSNMPTWMQAVRNVGYATSVFGKTHLHPHKGDLRKREHLVHRPASITSTRLQARARPVSLART